MTSYANKKKKKRKLRPRPNSHLEDSRSIQPTLLLAGHVRMCEELHHRLEGKKLQGTLDRHLGGLVVVVDRLTKMSHIPTEGLSVDELVEGFLERVYAQHGVSLTIVSDRGSQSTVISVPPANKRADRKDQRRDRISRISHRASSLHAAEAEVRTHVGSWFPTRRGTSTSRCLPGVILNGLTIETWKVSLWPSCTSVSTFSLVYRSPCSWYSP